MHSRSAREQFVQSICAGWPLARDSRCANCKRFTTIVGREARALWFAIASHNVLKPRTHKHTPTVIGAQSMRYADGNRNFEKRLMRGAKLYARRATMYTFFSGQIRDDINQQYGIYYHRKHPSLYFFFTNAGCYGYRRSCDHDHEDKAQLAYYLRRGI